MGVQLPRPRPPRPGPRQRRRRDHELAQLPRARPDLHAFVVQGRHAYPAAPPGTGWTVTRDVFAIAPGLLGSCGGGGSRCAIVGEAGRAAVEIDVRLPDRARRRATRWSKPWTRSWTWPRPPPTRDLIDKAVDADHRLSARTRKRSSGRTARRSAIPAAPPRWAPGRTRWSDPELRRHRRRRALHRRRLGDPGHPGRRHQAAGRSPSPSAPPTSSWERRQVTARPRRSLTSAQLPDD